MFWNHRFDHLSTSYLLTLSKKSIVKGLPSLDKLSVICSSCLTEKQHRALFYPSEHRASQPLQLVHTNMCRRMTPSHNGFRYFQLFVDDHTRKMWVYCLQHKDEVFSYFKEFHTLVEKVTNHCIRVLHLLEGKWNSTSIDCSIDTSAKWSY